MSVRFLDSFMSQRWEDLLLLHWPVSPSVLQPTLPRDLEVDLFEGSAWISVVGFKLTQLRISPCRWIRWPEFWEINLRTYIRNQQGKKGGLVLFIRFFGSSRGHGGAVPVWTAL